MSSKILAKALYALLGAAFIVVGLAVLSLDTGLLPASVSSAVMNAVRSDLNALHIVQEFGAVLVFAGLIAFWFVKHYAQSGFFHWAMTLAWGLIALAHWFDVRGAHSPIGPFINTVPFALFLIVGLLRMKTEGRRQKAEGSQDALIGP